MRLQFTVQDGHVFVGDGASSLSVELNALKSLSSA